MPMTITERKELRALQDRAIKAIELLMPNARDLENSRPTAQPPSPTIAESRRCLYPELRWCWEEWMQEAQKAGHDL